MHHNQLLLTRYWTTAQIFVQIIEPVDDLKMTPKVQPAADYWSVDQENLGTRLCYFGERKNKEWNSENL